MRISPKYDGDVVFSKLLRDLNCPHTLGEVKLLVLGIVMGEETVPLSFVLDEVFDVEEEEGRRFQSEDQHKEFYQNFFGLWNDLAQFRFGTKVPKLFSAPPNNKEDFDSLLLKAGELDSFLYGIELSGVPKIKGKKSGKFLLELEVLLDDILSHLKTQSKKDIENAKSLISVINDLWQKRFSLLQRPKTEK